MYLIFVYENKIIKPIEIILIKEEGWMRENDEGGESN
jgi:hypothetical protein